MFALLICEQLYHCLDCSITACAQVLLCWSLCWLEAQRWHMTHVSCGFILTPWLIRQGESRVQLFDLDSVGSIPAIPSTPITCFVEHFNKLGWLWCGYIGMVSLAPIHIYSVSASVMAHRNMSVLMPTTLICSKPVTGQHLNERLQRLSAPGSRPITPLCLQASCRSECSSATSRCSGQLSGRIVWPCRSSCGWTYKGICPNDGQVENPQRVCLDVVTMA